MGDVRPGSIFDLIGGQQTAHSKHDAILIAAARVFLRHGYEGASMDLVAKEAGAARRTLYNRFPDGKEALFHAVVERVSSAFPVLSITADMDALTDPEAGLRRIGEAVAAFWAPAMAVSFLRLVIAEGPRFPRLTESFFAVGKTPAMGAVRDYLLELSGRGLLDIPDAELATRQFLGLIDEPLLWVRVIGKAEEVTAEQRAAVVDGAVRMFLRHYRVPAKHKRGSRSMASRGSA